MCAPTIIDPIRDHDKILGEVLELLGTKMIVPQNVTSEQPPAFWRTVG